MKGPIHWMDTRGWGWRQWFLQILIVIAVAGFIIPIVLYGS
ncbi:hypothetical protein [Streptomyces sp. NBC_01615]